MLVYTQNVTYMYYTGIYCIQVTAYPGEILHVDVSPYDEQNYLTSENFQIVEDTYDHNVCIKILAAAVCNY